MKLIALIFLPLLCFANPLGQDSDDTRDFAEVTITQDLSDDPSEIVQQLIGILVKKSVLDKSSGARLLATFNIRGDGGAKAFTVETAGSQLLVKGDADARKKFVNHIVATIRKSQKTAAKLVEYLLELILDNELIDINEAAQLAADNGFGVNIQITKFSTHTVWEANRLEKTAPVYCSNPDWKWEWLGTTDVNGYWDGDYFVVSRDQYDSTLASCQAKKWAHTQPAYSRQSGNWYQFKILETGEIMPGMKRVATAYLYCSNPDKKYEWLGEETIRGDWDAELFVVANDDYHKVQSTCQAKGYAHSQPAPDKKSSKWHVFKIRETGNVAPGIRT